MKKSVILYNKHAYNIIWLEDKGVIIAISRYAGKPVKGIAKQHPDDKFSLVYGQKLAVARCAAKIAQKRKKAAINKYIKAIDDLTAAKKEYTKILDYVNKAYRDCDSDEKYLYSVEMDRA